MGINFQMHRASVNIAKGFRQFQKADNELAKSNYGSAVKHFDKGLNCFVLAEDHLGKAEDDAYSKAGKEVDKGNKELKKSMDEYDKGNVDSAGRHYASAINSYDEALNLID
jgi:hypothetical protein